MLWTIAPLKERPNLTDGARVPHQPGLLAAGWQLTPSLQSVEEHRYRIIAPPSHRPAFRRRRHQENLGWFTATSQLIHRGVQCGSERCLQWSDDICSVMRLIGQDQPSQS